MAGIHRLFQNLAKPRTLAVQSFQVQERDNEAYKIKHTESFDKASPGQLQDLQERVGESSFCGSRQSIATEILHCCI